MLDLDKYINNSVKVTLFKKEYDILEPSVKMVMEVDKIESNLTEKNIHDKRVETALLLLNNNRQNKIFQRNEMLKLPFEAITRLIAEIGLLRYEADTDPNSTSRSQAEK